jgi:hypothetical protein
VGLLQTLRTDVGLPMRGSYPPHLFEQGNDEPAVKVTVTEVVE